MVLGVPLVAVAVPVTAVGVPVEAVPVAVAVAVAESQSQSLSPWGLVLPPHHERAREVFRTIGVWPMRDEKV